jgi:hypothetical protein
MGAKQSVKELMSVFWNDYVTLNPLAQKIHDYFLQEGEQVVNDHIAFRTLNYEGINISSMEKIFLELGYKENGHYTFTEKKLFAKHYEHSDPKQPKIFISELLVEKLSPASQEILKKLYLQLTPAQKNNPLLCASGKHWNLSLSDYQVLKAESEYASWLSAYGFRVNHFTVLINELKKFTTVEAVNHFLKEKNISLNTSGGEIKGTPQELLEQSSTIAGTHMVEFSDEIYSVPSTYYEFARRYAMPTGNLYQGFIAASADKIFESTNRGQ